MEEKLISRENLNLFVSGLIENNMVIGESAGGTGWKKIAADNEIVIGNSKIPSNISYKEFIFAKTEPVLYFRSKKDNFDLIEPSAGDQRMIFFGVKPCDASSIEIMSKVFNWDFKDRFFNERAAKAVIIGTACGYRDEFCFCTSVGSSPVSERGSDLFLVPLDENNFAVRIVTGKGKELIGEYSQFFSEGNPVRSGEVLSGITGPEKKFDSSKIKDWIGVNFEHKLFDEIGSTCLGCGQCAFVCPVCHCFDIVDEECDYSCGRRMKNWDACQFPIFTLHASGHNPRSTEGKRYRQRLAHKFKYYHDKFGEILCTGCGRCSRGCPAGIDIAQAAVEIDSIAEGIKV